MAREIPLTRGDLVALVDDEDFEWLSQFRWRLSCGYASRQFQDGEKCTTRLMHREVAGAGLNEITDHINGNRLDNRRANLRLCGYIENAWNRSCNRASASGIKGVAACGNRWRARIRVAGKRFALGNFSTPEEAGRAYDVAATFHFGSFARLNYPSQSDELGPGSV